VDALLQFNVVHRDIKDENIVVDKNYHVKLIDFGSAAFLPTNGRLFDRFAGTVQYCPPEILRGEKYRGPEQEIWSLGVLLFTLMFGEPPFRDPQSTVNGALYVPPRSKRVQGGNFTEAISPHLVKLLCGYSEASVDLLVRMLVKRPTERPTIKQVLEHPWLKGGSASNSRQSSLG
ncbi:kinase-like domain-containing protein, partial [Catenaria anguillulae PL171]